MGRYASLYIGIFTLNIDKLFEDAVDENDTAKLEQYLQLLMDKWVFFVLLETGNNNTPVSSGNVEHIITSSKENPIKHLTINNEMGNNAVIYTSCDLAERLAEIDCKIGKMKGVKAFQMFLNMSSIDAVYVQADNCNVRIPKSEIARLITNNA